MRSPHTYILQMKSSTLTGKRFRGINIIIGIPVYDRTSSFLLYKIEETNRILDVRNRPIWFMEIQTWSMLMVMKIYSFGFNAVFYKIATTKKCTYENQASFQTTTTANPFRPMKKILSYKNLKTILHLHQHSYLYYPHSHLFFQYLFSFLNFFRPDIF